MEIKDLINDRVKFDGYYIWSMKNNSEFDKVIAEPRGFGKETGTIIDVKDKLGQFIADAINEKLERERAGRVETGAYKFGDDWTGVFLRGDNALAYAAVLEQVLRSINAPLFEAQLEDLKELLFSCRENGDEKQAETGENKKQTIIRFCIQELIQELREEFLLNTQNYSKEYHDIFSKKIKRVVDRINEKYNSNF